MANEARARAAVGEVFTAFLKLGLTSFSGPIAHLGYFREEFVNRRKWITDRAYADLVALCQFTPGPASSKVGIGICRRVGSGLHSCILQAPTVELAHRQLCN